MYSPKNKVALDCGQPKIFYVKPIPTKVKNPLIILFLCVEPFVCRKQFFQQKFSSGKYFFSEKKNIIDFFF